MRILIGLLALMLGACSHEPFTPAPPIAKLDIRPVADGNKAISSGNKKIADSVQKVQTQLEVVRSKLDQAILDAEAQKVTDAQLDQNLRDASTALNAAITENTNLRMTTYAQQALIDKQDEVIKDLSDNNEARQKIIDMQTKELTEKRQIAADYDKLQKDVNAYWGLGAVGYGLKRLGWRVLILVIVLGLAMFALQLFAPWARPLLSVVGGFLAWPFKWLLAKLKPKSPS